MGKRSTQKCWGKLVSQLETRDREWPGALWGLKLSFIGEENAQGEGGRKGARWARNSCPGWVTTTCHDLVFRFSWLTFVFFEGFPSLQIYMMNPREAPISDCEGLHSDGQVWEGPLTLAISFLSQLLMWLLEGKKKPPLPWTWQTRLCKLLQLPRPHLSLHKGAILELWQSLMHHGL